MNYRTDEHDLYFCIVCPYSPTMNLEVCMLRTRSKVVGCCR